MAFKVSSQLCFKAPSMKMSWLVICATRRDSWAVTQSPYGLCLSPVEARNDTKDDPWCILKRKSKSFQELGIR